MDKTEKKEKEFGKRIYLLIGAAAIFIVFCLGLINTWKDLLDSQAQWLRTESVYIRQMVEWQEGFDDADSLLKQIETDKNYDAIIGSEAQYCYVYDEQKNVLIGTGDTSRVERIVTSAVRKSDTWHGYQYESVETGDRYLIILEKDLSEIRTSFLQRLPLQLLILLAAFLIFWGLCILLDRPGVSGSAKIRFLSGAVFLAILLVTAAGSYAGWNNQVKSWEKTKDAIYADLDADVNYICMLPDSRAEALAESADSPEEARKTLAALAAKFYEVAADNITVDQETILDTDLPIRSRVTVGTNGLNIFNVVFTYILEAVMYAILAVFVFRAIFYYRSNLNAKKTLSRDAAEIRTSMDRLKLIVTVKSFSDAITATVTAKMLKSYLQADTGNAASKLMTITIFAGTVLAVTAVLLVPVMLRGIKRVTHIMTMMLAACFAGNLLCFLADGSLLYVIGYLMIIAGNAVFGMMFLLVPVEMMNPGDRFLKESSNSSTGRHTGQIVGYVVSGTLVSLIPYRYMFLIAAVLLGLVMYPAMKLTCTKNRQQFPLTSHSFAALKKKKFLLFLLLVQAPYAMVSYYFKYVVPLKVDAMQLTASFVSFVFFFRMVMRLVFKIEPHVRAFWKKFRPETGVMVILLSISVLFVLLRFLPGITWMIILTLLIGFFEARLSMLIYSTGFENLDNSTDYFFGFQGSSTVCFNIGNSCAAALTEGIDVLALPVVMSASAIIYWIVIRHGRKKKSG